MIVWDNVLVELTFHLIENSNYYLYRLSGLGIRLGLGANSRGATLFNFFIRRRTRSQRCIEEMLHCRLVTWLIPPDWSPCIVFASCSHGDSRHCVAVVLSFWSVKRQHWINSFASFETLEKYSFGKLKSHPKIFVFVSSSESSRNGDFPLFWEMKIKHKHFDFSIW